MKQQNLKKQRVKKNEEDKPSGDRDHKAKVMNEEHRRTLDSDPAS
jgi:hypothetical protein